MIFRPCFNLRTKKALGFSPKAEKLRILRIVLVHPLDCMGVVASRGIGIADLELCHDAVDADLSRQIPARSWQVLLPLWSA